MEFYPGFEVKKKRKYNKTTIMSDSLTKFKEMEETRSYSGLGEWVESNTDDIMMEGMGATLEGNPTQIFRELLEKFRGWEESWRHYGNNPEVIEKPLNADEFSQDLANRYEIEEI
jgi:hypothetical protein